MPLFANWQTQHYVWGGITAGALFLFFVLIPIVKYWRKKHRNTELDCVGDGYQFEAYIAQLLRRNGFINVDVTKASSDYGVDVTAEKDDITYAIQCKFYNQPVGVKAVQEVLAGKLYYDCHVAVVATNSTFTRNAVELAKKTKVLLWDEDKLARL